MKRNQAIIDAPIEESGECRVNHGPLDMRIARDGKWFYHGTPIPRKEMVCLFASTLTRRPDGSYWLVTPSEEGCIEVEDVPFLAVELFVCGSGRETVFSFRTNVDEIVTLDRAHSLRIVCKKDGAPPYLTVREGLEARLTRSVYYEIVALGLEETIDGERLYGVWSKGIFFPLGKLDSVI
ncbi:DUF1285 domain-containing protein [Telmatospirillum siberiense]|uniref:DUF1285 domain-containing protein n=1 Tax=Telmatospirillum siberiense TaxID=382514 RepID=A0A2N3PTU4_9PROT|nr:DUF1285 domain-containing protein [Telmatospirillum siberiense]PKU23806.1 DUF1285 domain-containing protein [Telmatospirillum siberiense]